MIDEEVHRAYYLYYSCSRNNNKVLGSIYVDVIVELFVMFTIVMRDTPKLEYHKLEFR